MLKSASLYMDSIMDKVLISSASVILLKVLKLKTEIGKHSYEREILLYNLFYHLFKLVSLSFADDTFYTLSFSFMSHAAEY